MQAASVISSANSLWKLNSTSVTDLVGARSCYETAILDWQEEAHSLMDAGNGGEYETLRGEIVTLWISYAALNRRAKAFKTTNSTYEAATACPHAGSSVRIWEDYARYYEERDKLAAAQKIYIRAIDKLTGADVNVVWADFLRMMQQSGKQPTLTLDELKEAVKNEITDKPRADSTQDASQPAANGAANDAAQPTVAVVVKTEPVAPEPMEVDAPRAPIQPPEKKTRQSPPALVPSSLPSSLPSSPPPSSSVNPQLFALQENSAAMLNMAPPNNLATLSPSILAGYIAKDGGVMPVPPPSLFEPVPIAMKDPSGAEFLGGAEIALTLLKLYLKRDGVFWVLEGCWMMSAVAERRAAEGIVKVEKEHEEQMGVMRVQWAEREAKAQERETGQVKAANQNELSVALSRHNASLHNLQSAAVWQLRLVLYAQQIILTAAGVPGFNGATIDRRQIILQKRIAGVCQAAFMMRKKVGSVGYKSVIEGMAQKLEMGLIEKEGEKALEVAAIEAAGAAALAKEAAAIEAAGAAALAKEEGGLEEVVEVVKGEKKKVTFNAVSQVKEVPRRATRKRGK